MAYYLWYLPLQARVFLNFYGQQFLERSTIDRKQKPSRNEVSIFTASIDLQK
jgi:hypothetical protein